MMANAAAGPPVAMDQEPMGCGGRPKDFEETPMACVETPKRCGKAPMRLGKAAIGLGEAPNDIGEPRRSEIRDPVLARPGNSLGEKCRPAAPRGTGRPGSGRLRRARL